MTDKYEKQLLHMISHYEEKMATLKDKIEKYKLRSITSDVIDHKRFMLESWNQLIKDMGHKKEGIESSLYWYRKI